MENGEKGKTATQTLGEQTVVWEIGQGKKSRKSGGAAQADSGKGHGTGGAGNGARVSGGGFGNVVPFVPKSDEATFEQLNIPIGGGKRPLVITTVSSGFGRARNATRPTVPKCAA